MLNDEDLSKCYFVPKDSMDRAIEFLDQRQKVKLINRRCKHDLWMVQQKKAIPIMGIHVQRWRLQCHIELNRAIYTHDWDRLLRQLIKSPIWEHTGYYGEIDVYVRALTILLMYHPSARAKSSLMDYMHMVLSCRTDLDKKAMLKALLTLPDKLTKKNRTNRITNN